MGFARKMDRAQAKVAYLKFGRSWRTERRYQEALTARGEKLPEETPRLGKKPTFSQWLKVVKTTAARRAEAIEVKEFIDDTNLDWEEEKV